MTLSLRAEKLSIPGSDPNFLYVQVLANLWDAETNPDGFINLGFAENSLMRETLLEHIHRYMEIPASALTYGDGYKRLRRAVARFLTRHLKPVTAIEPEHIIVSNGVTTAIENLAWALANPGDFFLMGRPYYGTFPFDIGKRTGVEFMSLAFGGLDPVGLEAVGRYEEAILSAQQCGRRIAAILLAHPHNPLGRCYSREVLVEYMKLCQRHRIHLISDEIYALSVFENTVDRETVPVPFQSILSIDSTQYMDPGLIHVFWGMSKDFGANGLRMGFTITQHHQALLTALQSVFEFSWTSSLSDLVTSIILEDDEWVDGYVRENQRKLSQHHNKVVTWARKHGIEYAVGARAGFFVWVNLGAAYRRHHAGEIADIDKAVMDSLLAHRILLSDGLRFGSEEPGWFRIIFSHPADFIDHSLGRIIAAVKGESLERPPTGNGHVNGHTAQHGDKTDVAANNPSG